MRTAAFLRTGKGVPSFFSKTHLRRQDMAPPEEFALLSSAPASNPGRLLHLRMVQGWPTSSSRVKPVICSMAWLTDKITPSISTTSNPSIMVSMTVFQNWSWPS